MKRIRAVYPDREIADIWAKAPMPGAPDYPTNGEIPTARSKGNVNARGSRGSWSAQSAWGANSYTTDNGSRISFVGPRLYSYRTEIARKFDFPSKIDALLSPEHTGKRWAWITTENYSKTTTRHTHAACAAAHAEGMLILRTNSRPDDLRSVVDVESAQAKVDRLLIGDSIATTTVELLTDVQSEALDFAVRIGERPWDLDRANGIASTLLDRARQPCAPIILRPGAPLGEYDEPGTLAPTLNVAPNVDGPTPTNALWVRFAVSLAHRLRVTGRRSKYGAPILAPFLPKFRRVCDAIAAEVKAP